MNSIEEKLMELRKQIDELKLKIIGNNNDIDLYETCIEILELDIKKMKRLERENNIEHMFESVSDINKYFIMLEKEVKGYKDKIMETNNEKVFNEYTIELLESKIDTVNYLKKVKN